MSVFSDFTMSYGIVLKWRRASVPAYAKEFTNGKSYSTSYEADSTDDSVVLSMTPYTRYVYKSYVPGFKLPTQSRYNGLKKQLEQYKSSYRDGRTGICRDQAEERNILSI